MSKLTEKALLATLKELLEDHPLDKISVKMLTEKCGVSRNTFYYHFHDIYEMTRLYFLKETEYLIGRYQEVEKWEGGFLEGLNFLYSNKRMIEHIYKSVNRDELEKFLNEVVYRHALIVVERSVQGRQYSQEVLEKATDFYKCALIGNTMEWIENDMRESPEVMAALYSSVFEGTVNAVFDSIERVISCPSHQCSNK